MKKYRKKEGGSGRWGEGEKCRGGEKGRG